MKQERFHKTGDFSPVSRRNCESCNQERLFQNYKCLTCGAARKYIPLPNSKIYKGSERRKRLRIYAQKGRDKAAYLRAQAEASRKKFEGGA